MHDVSGHMVHRIQSRRPSRRLVRDGRTIVWNPPPLRAARAEGLVPNMATPPMEPWAGVRACRIESVNGEGRSLGDTVPSL